MDDEQFECRGRRKRFTEWQHVCGWGGSRGWKLDTSEESWWHVADTCEWVLGADPRPPGMLDARWMHT